MPLLKSLDENLTVFGGGVVIDDDAHRSYSSHLRTGAHGSGIDGFGFVSREAASSDASDQQDQASNDTLEKLFVRICIVPSGA